MLFKKKKSARFGYTPSFSPHKTKKPTVLFVHFVISHREQELSKWNLVLWFVFFF